MAKKTTSYRARLLESLIDPEEAASYLNAAREDSPEMFGKALLDVTQAQEIVRSRKAEEYPI
jgi:hypothetical protein